MKKRSYDWASWIGGWLNYLRIARKKPQLNWSYRWMDGHLHFIAMSIPTSSSFFSLLISMLHDFDVFLFRSCYLYSVHNLMQIHCMMNARFTCFTQFTFFLFFALIIYIKWKYFWILCLSHACTFYLLFMILCCFSRRFLLFRLRLTTESENVVKEEETNSKRSSSNFRETYTHTLSLSHTRKHTINEKKMMKKKNAKSKNIQQCTQTYNAQIYVIYTL